jgi:hypothetical protein
LGFGPVVEKVACTLCDKKFAPWRAGKGNKASVAALPAPSSVRQLERSISWIGEVKKAL